MKDMKLHYIQHESYEGLGCIEGWAEENGFELSSTKLYKGEKLPSVDSFDFLVIMGGPMGVHDAGEYPWLEDEFTFVGQVINNNTPVLGVCLGSQVIAHCLGAEIYKASEKEIGWFPITSSSPKGVELGFLPAHCEVFHWHGETYDLPKGAELLASSTVCENQAFVYNNKVVGLQFHLEVSGGGIKEFIDNNKNELVEAPYIQTESAMLSCVDKTQDINGYMFAVLDYLKQHL